MPRYASAANPKFAHVSGAPECELRVQKRHYKHRVASVLLDSKVRTSVPQMVTNFGIGTLVHALVNAAFKCHKSKSSVILLPRLVLAACAFTPALRVNFRKARVAVRRLAHLCDDEPRRQRQRLLIDVGAAGDDDGAAIAPQRVAARSFERRVETRCDQNSRRAE